MDRNQTVALSSAEEIGIGLIGLHEWNRLTYESYMKFQLGRETRAGGDVS
jgi:hypothetical protein